MSENKPSRKYFCFYCEEMHNVADFDITYPGCVSDRYGLSKEEAKKITFEQFCANMAQIGHPVEIEESK